MFLHSKKTGTKETRTIKKTVPCETFFNFFKPLQVPEEEDEEAELPEDFEEKIEMDYEVGETLKEKIVPRAIDWCVFFNTSHSAGLQERHSMMKVSWVMKKKKKVDKIISLNVMLFYNTFIPSTLFY